MKILLIFAALFVLEEATPCDLVKDDLDFNHSQGTAPRILPPKIIGVTLDSIAQLPLTLDALGSLSKKPMTRIVFDESLPATFYTLAVSQISQRSYVLGAILDSSAMKSYSPNQYQKRTLEYLNAMSASVDLWEIGNEINGEWLGNTSDVVAKISAGFDIVKSKNGSTALTLYYNPNCWEKPSHEMFRWAEINIPDRIKAKLDYIFVSYYEEDCNGFQPDWKAVMAQVAEIFPNSKLGIGECGTRDPLKKEELIKKYFSMNVDLPSFVGGYFWWYFKQDMVPKTKPLWKVLNEVISQK